MQNLPASVLLVLTLLFTPTLARADNANATGTITGRVLDIDGKPLKGAKVIAREHIPPPPRGATPPKEKPVYKIFATATTAADGTYKLEKVPVGVCRVAANLESSKDRRYFYAPNPTVVANKTITAGDIKFTKPKEDEKP